MPADEFFERIAKHVQSVYPGLQCWLDMQRDPETGVTTMFIFDQERGVRPQYVVAIHPRDILAVGNPGLTIPIMTGAQSLHAKETGELPPGWISANYPSPSQEPAP
jgi:hypothetical protein